MSDTSKSLDQDRLLALFRALRQHRVDYLVVGAVALGPHGLGRTSLGVDLFLRPKPANIERLRLALHQVFADPEIDEITADDLCGEYPAVRYIAEDGFAVDILTRLGEAFKHDDLEVEEFPFDDTTVRLVSAKTLWLMKKGTLRYKDQIDAAALAEQFGFRED